MRLAAVPPVGVKVTRTLTRTRLPRFSRRSAVLVGLRRSVTRPAFVALAVATLISALRLLFLRRCAAEAPADASDARSWPGPGTFTVSLAEPSGRLLALPKLKRLLGSSGLTG